MPNLIWPLDCGDQPRWQHLEGDATATILRQQKVTSPAPPASLPCLHASFDDKPER